MKKINISNTLSNGLVAITLTAGLLTIPLVGRALTQECPNPGSTGQTQYCCSLQGVHCDHDSYFGTTPCSNVSKDGNNCKGANSNNCQSYSDNYGPCTPSS